MKTKYKITVDVNTQAKAGQCVTVQVESNGVVSTPAYASGDQSVDAILALVTNEAKAFIGDYPFGGTV